MKEIGTFLLKYHWLEWIATNRTSQCSFCLFARQQFKMWNKVNARCRLRGGSDQTPHPHADIGIRVCGGLTVPLMLPGAIPLCRNLKLLHFCMTLMFISFFLFQSFSKKAVDHVQSHLAKKQVPPTLFQVKGHCTYLCVFL